MAIFGTKKDKTKDTAVATTDAATNTNVPAVGAAAAVLVRPHITEKAFAASQRNVYTFEIAPGTNKHEVKAAIKAVYQVTPQKVHIVKKRPRVVRSQMRQRTSHQSGLTKAYVYLKDGDTINFM